MKASECYVGMKTSLPMEYDKSEQHSHKAPMGKATCIWIHPRGIYALFQFDHSGIKTTAYLDDESRWAKNTVVPPIVVPPELKGRQKKEHPAINGNNEKIKEALYNEHVAMTTASVRGGHSQRFLSETLVKRGLSDEETERWLRIIHEIAKERDNRYYVIRKALDDTGLSMRAASKLLGHNIKWLSCKFMKVLSAEEQLEIAAMIRKAASDRSESTQSDSVD